MVAPGIFWACMAGVGYVFVGYPAALWILSRRRRQPEHEPIRPPVSLIIAAFNEEGTMRDKLENTLAIDYPDLEVIVVTDGSEDATPAIASEFGDRGVVVLHEPARAGKSAALNRGVAAASGEILVFSDANNRFDVKALQALVSAFADPSVGGATGQKTVEGCSTVGEPEGLYWRYEAAIRVMESTLGACTGSNGEILAVRKRCFTPIPVDVINDDGFLTLTILADDHRFVYVPEAISIEHPADSLASERERRARMTAGRIHLVRRGLVRRLPPLARWQYVSHKLGRLASAPLMAAAGLAAVSALRGSSARRGPAALGGGWARVAVGGHLLIYMAAAIGARGSEGLPSGLRKACRAASFLVAGNTATAIGVVRAVSGNQPVQWRRVGRQE